MAASYIYLRMNYNFKTLNMDTAQRTASTFGQRVYRVAECRISKNVDQLNGELVTRLKTLLDICL
jgi:hypothetical protein